MIALSHNIIAVEKMKSFLAVVAALVTGLLSGSFTSTTAFMAPQHNHYVNNEKSLCKSPCAFGVTGFQQQHTLRNIDSMPIVLQRQRRSIAVVTTQGLFGLGAAEIGIILVAAAFLLGPQKLAELGRDAGKMAGELKEVPKEFQKGIAEGEKEAQLMKKESMKETGGAIAEAETVEEKK